MPSSAQSQRAAASMAASSAARCLRRGRMRFRLTDVDWRGASEPARVVISASAGRPAAGCHAGWRRRPVPPRSPARTAGWGAAVATQPARRRQPRSAAHPAPVHRPGTPPPRCLVRRSPAGRRRDGHSQTVVLGAVQGGGVGVPDQAMDHHLGAKARNLSAFAAGVLVGR